MAKVDYKRIWQELKEERIEEYVMLQEFNHQYPNVGFYKIYSTTLTMILKRMDMLDRTAEFHNLLHDLKRGE
ncbi:hypothetical protein MUA11_08050 [Staphylococcus agnetis]|uniref:hypothetical protein n=1 Tax=Staphylococcus agnetis TaxID=985762 RepID=UPI0021CE5765|nr:hypothetical protein [Staphylococcus agnetis]UXU54264.1 hypothetical protein MUA11_08050 [Staphylococcus agnetis]